MKIIAGFSRGAQRRRSTPIDKGVEQRVLSTGFEDDEVTNSSSNSGLRQKVFPSLQRATNYLNANLRRVASELSPRTRKKTSKTNLKVLSSPESIRELGNVVWGKSKLQTNEVRPFDEQNGAVIEVPSMKCIPCLRR